MWSYLTLDSNTLLKLSEITGKFWTLIIYLMAIKAYYVLILKCGNYIIVMFNESVLIFVINTRDDIISEIWFKITWHGGNKFLPIRWNQIGHESVIVRVLHK